MVCVDEITEAGFKIGLHLIILLRGSRNLFPFQNYFERIPKLAAAKEIVWADLEIGLRFRILMTGS